MNDSEKDNIIKSKSYKFALRIIKLYRYLCDEKKNMLYLNNYLDAEHLLVLI
jgi:hypothetical protein